MTSKEKKIFHIAITIAIMVFIFIQSALTADLSMHESNVIVKWLSSFLHVQAETLSFIVRKCAHFLEYLILGISMYVSVHDLSRWKQWKNAILAFLICAVYAATDELHQMFVQGRSCEARDILIDSLGALLGILIMSLISFLRAKKKQTEEDH